MSTTINTRPFRRKKTPLPNALTIEHRAPSQRWRFFYHIECLKASCRHLLAIRGNKKSNTKEEKAWKKERDERLFDIKRGIHSLKNFLIINAVVPFPGKPPKLTKQELLSYVGTTSFAAMDRTIQYLTNTYKMDEEDRLNNLELTIAPLSWDIFDMERSMRPLRGDKNPLVVEIRKDLTKAKKVLLMATAQLRDRQDKINHAHKDTVQLQKAWA